MFDSFKGAYLHTERYSVAQAANPCLEIDGIGVVGLPLSANDAQVLLSDTHAFGSASGLKRPEIATDKVRYTNPEWDAWFQKEAGLVCTALVGRKAKPVCRFQKLVLEGPDAQVPSNEGIAKLVVVLPSLFQGGDILFEHGIQSTTVRLAPESQLLTSIVATYPAVKSTMTAVTSGYRLSLHYIPEPVADNPIPPVPDTDGAALALRQALVGWKEGSTADKAAEIVACFLQRKYAWEGFTLQALAGPDALLMAHLSRLATEFDYQLYLVQDLEPVETWPPQTRERAFDMNSVPVNITGFNFEKGGPHGYLNGKLEDAEPEDEYDMEGTWGVRVDETYQRTLFLLWPTGNDSEKPVKVRYIHKEGLVEISGKSEAAVKRSAGDAQMGPPAKRART
ncbi:hypothetical protein DFH09DRAFT_1167496 [Mycena vulgaris]|nr:hypothetical protein DFH09DRAFT_1167496 [Mycena vulgaris]